MIIALQNKNARLVELKPAEKKLLIRKWQSELDYLEKEVAFYKQLIRTGIQNSGIQNRSSLGVLLRNFSKYEKIVLPEMRLDFSKCIKQVEMQEETSLSFQEKLETHQQKLGKMKKKVFSLSPSFQRITIW